MNCLLPMFKLKSMTNVIRQKILLQSIQLWSRNKKFTWETNCNPTGLRTVRNMKLETVFVKKKWSQWDKSSLPTFIKRNLCTGHLLLHFPQKSNDWRDTELTFGEPFHLSLRLVPEPLDGFGSWLEWLVPGCRHPALWSSTVEWSCSGSWRWPGCVWTPSWSHLGVNLAAVSS